MDNMSNWTQIHTNGATTTFARWYRLDAPSGTTFVFEKMAADVVNGTTEVFGREEFGEWHGVDARMAEAVSLYR